MQTGLSRSCKNIRSQLHYLSITTSALVPQYCQARLSVYIPQLASSRLVPSPRNVCYALMLWTRTLAMHPLFAIDSQITLCDTVPNCWLHHQAWRCSLLGCSVEPCSTGDKGLTHHDGRRKWEVGTSQTHSSLCTQAKLYALLCSTVCQCNSSEQHVAVCFRRAGLIVRGT